MVLFGLTDRHERDIYVHFKLGVKIRQIRHHSSPNFESRNFPEFSNPNPNPWSTIYLFTQALNSNMQLYIISIDH